MLFVLQVISDLIRDLLLSVREQHLFTEEQNSSQAGKSKIRRSQ